MADWTTITDTQVDPKAPVTSELMTALRDNPLAIAEGSTNAPKIAQSLRYAFVGINTYATISNLDAGDGVHGVVTASGGISTSTTLTVEFSSDGSTFTNSQTLGSGFNASGNVGFRGDFYFDFASQLFICSTLVHVADSHGLISINTTLSGVTATTHMRFLLSGSGASGATGCNVIAYVNGGTAAT